MKTMLKTLLKTAMAATLVASAAMVQRMTRVTFAAIHRRPSCNQHPQPTAGIKVMAYRATKVATRWRA